MHVVSQPIFSPLYSMTLFDVKQTSTRRSSQNRKSHGGLIQVSMTPTDGGVNVFLQPLKKTTLLSCSKALMDLGSLISPFWCWRLLPRVLKEISNLSHNLPIEWNPVFGIFLQNPHHHVLKRAVRGNLESQCGSVRRPNFLFSSIVYASTGDNSNKSLSLVF